MPVRLPFRLLGAVAAALVIAASVLATTQRGTAWPWVQGAGLVVFALAATAQLFAPPLRPGAGAALLGVCGAALVGVYWAQPAGVPVGMFLVAAFATMRPPPRLMLAVLAALAAAFCAVQLPNGNESPASAAAVLAGMAFFAGIGTLLLSERRQRERVTSLLVELDEARAAEREASALAARTAAAREVHDVLAHSLSGLVIQLEAARLQARSPGARAELQTSLDNALRSARSGLDEAKRAVATMRGDRPQGPADIPALIEEHRLSTGMPTTFRVVGEPRALADDAALALYRAAQEALSNIRKHAPGAATDVVLSWRPQRVTLAVSNPITGATPEGDGWGLAGLRERVQALDGSFRAGPVDDRYLLHVELPIGTGSSAPR